MSTKAPNTDETYYEDYGYINYRKKYTCTNGQNHLVSEETYETTDGERLKQTYQDNKGYTFTAYKKGNKVTCITVNKPNGTEKSQLTLNMRQFEFDEVSKSKKRKVLKSLPELVAKGASLSEIYQNFSDLTGVKVPTTDLPKDNSPKELSQTEIQKAADAYFTDIEVTYLYTPEERQKIAADMRARNKMLDKNIEKMTAALQTQEMPDFEAIKQDVLQQPQSTVIYAQSTDKNR